MSLIIQLGSGGGNVSVGGSTGSRHLDCGMLQICVSRDRNVFGNLSETAIGFHHPCTQIQRCQVFDAEWMYTV